MPQLAFSDFFYYLSVTYFNYFFFAFLILSFILPLINSTLKLRVWYRLELFLFIKTILSQKININKHSLIFLKKNIDLYLTYLLNLKKNI